ncbi:MAG: Sua5/YciO/YrdC/YwlC family protein [Anaerohalosphaeraceae bacterium]
METELIKLGKPLNKEAVRKVVRALEQGAIAALPTETGYGLAARALPDTLAGLDDLKEGAPAPHTVLLGKKEDISKYVPKVLRPVMKLIRNCWPGPLLLVFEMDQEGLQKMRSVFPEEICRCLYEDGRICLYCPESEETREISSSTVLPVLMSSLNSEKFNPYAPADVYEYFKGKIDLVVDLDECSIRNKKTFSVVKYGASGLEIIEEGSFSSEMLRKNSLIKILFVCSGNTCRSPMAEAICKKILSDKLGCSIDSLERFGYKVESAGVFAADGLRASKESDIICREYGVSLNEHKSRFLTKQALQESDLVFVMTECHLSDIERMRPSDFQAYLLDKKAEIPDPAGQDIDVYRRCARQIERALRERIEEIL